MISRKKIFSFSFTILSIFGYGLFAFAITQPYTPGETNDPTCAPNSTNCYVEQLFATTNSTYTWIGNGSGQNGGSTDNTFFAGIGAGDGATNADYSNFIGTGAGTNAVNANNSNFFGQSAGCNATNADNSNFFGQEAGCYATEANNSNFFGNSAGWTAVNAAYSTFFGDKAGYLAADATRSNFIGYNAGAYATGAYNSNLMGYRAGMGATNAHDSTFLGYEAGSGPSAGVDGVDTVGAVGARNSLLIGYQAGYNELSEPEFLTPGSNPFFSLVTDFDGNVSFLGYQAGFGAAGAAQSTFVGYHTGYKANTAVGSTIVGYMSGSSTGYSTWNSPNLVTSTILGAYAGVDTQRVDSALFLGNGTGTGSQDVRNVVSIAGSGGANDTQHAYYSIFMGTSAGSNSQHVGGSIFLGESTGFGAQNITNGIFIGAGAGSATTSTSAATQVVYSNLSGTFQPGETVKGSIGLTPYQTIIVEDNGSQIGVLGLNVNFSNGETITGQDSGATATVDTVTIGGSIITIGTDSSPNGHTNTIALGGNTKNSADNQFMIGSPTNPIDELYIQSSGGACIAGVTGFSCSSDERLKKDITDLDPVLDTLDQVRTVNYKWKVGDTKNHIGFIAQDLKEYFPELVTTDSQGYYLVNYANMTPVLVQAIRELNLKIENIDTLANMMNKSGLIAWFGDVANGITHFVAGLIEGDTVKAKNQLCVGSRCITPEQFNQLLDQTIGSGVSNGFGYGYGQ